MTHLCRQTYLDVELSAVNTHNHPICQVKYDGIWCDAVITHNSITHFSRHGLIKKTTSIPPHTYTPGHYIGEYMYGSEWAQQPHLKEKLFLFDYLPPDYRSGWNTPYEERIMSLRGLPLPKDFEVVECYSSVEKDNMWTLLVEPGLVEGLVFRHPQDTWLSTLLRAKGEVTEDLQIVGFEEGADGFTGMLGAFLCKDKTTNVIHTIGGGIPHDIRKRVWVNPTAYLGKWIRITAKKKFESGLFRHPNYHSFHEDK